jgi:serine/threonine protein kinase
LLALAETAGVAETDEPRQASPPPNCPGSWFGSYELLEQIGEGGMGVVFKARQRTLNRIVALKMMRSGSLASESEVKRFRSEAQAVARLQHPNVVAIHEVGEHDGQLFFSMDYIEGKNLAEVVRRTPLPAERAARYVKTIAEATHYAHERGILHRDLKPANVLIDASDQPRITDFGLAKHIETDSDLTVSGAVMGTPSYMPPEQAAGRRKEIGPASDVYSLGAILYDLLTGRPPFRADTPVDTLRQVLDTEPAPPRLLNAKIPRDLETVCLKCLAKEPGQRYPSARELAEDLGRFLLREPIQARPVGRLGRLWRWCRRNPALAGLVGAVGMMFLLLAVAAIESRKAMEGLTFFAAEQTAKLISEELNKLPTAVAEVSKDASLPLLIKARETNALKVFLETWDKSINESGLTWMEGKPFESWSLFDANGELLARWPEVSLEVSLTNRGSFNVRDHFKGAMKQSPKPYISKVFRSWTDVKQDKFGVTIGIRDGEGEQASIVAVLLATVTTSSTRTLSNIQHNAEVVLIGAADASDRGLQPWAIMSHPAYTHASEAIRINHSPTNMPTKFGRLYFDPAASKHKLYAGPWLAGIQPIKETDFFVIVQTRDYVAYALVTAAAVAALAASLFVGWRFFRRSANARTGRVE